MSLAEKGLEKVNDLLSILRTCCWRTGQQRVCAAQCRRPEQSSRIGRRPASGLPERLCCPPPWQRPGSVLACSSHTIRFESTAKVLATHAEVRQNLMVAKTMFPSEKGSRYMGEVPMKSDTICKALMADVAEP